MIKNFLDADEDDSLIVKKSFDEEPKDEKDFEQFAAPFSEIEKTTAEANEIPAPKNAAAPLEPVGEMTHASNEAKNFNTVIEPPREQSNEEAFWERQVEALKNDNLQQPDSFQTNNFQTLVEPSNETVNFTLPFREDAPVNFESPTENEAAVFQFPAAEDVATNVGTRNEAGGEKPKDDLSIFSNSKFQSETPDETIRKSGLAYAAAIVLFGSIVFTLVLGWFADLLLGTAPWGKVGGIVLGAIIGFIQFFRTTSQILKDKD